MQPQWLALPLTLTADASQVVDLVRGQAFQALILDGGLPGRALLHHARPGQRRLDPSTPGRVPDAPLLPRHALPGHLAAALAPWPDEALAQQAPARA